jgi:pimeloyl-ACP methyl ester carboxylesterase
VPAVFVHGVPDTGELWDPVLEQLGRDDTIALRLPGFGEPVPDGFGCTKESYADWITEQLRAIDEPVDLVGHDWGSILVQRVATTHPELVRTYTSRTARSRARCAGTTSRSSGRRRTSASRSWS